MKKNFYFIFILLIVGCASIKEINTVNKYVLQIENDKNLNESIREIKDEEGQIYTREYRYTANDTIKKIYKESFGINETVTNFMFIYKDYQLIYADVYDIFDNGVNRDTTGFVSFYFDNKNLVKEKIHTPINNSANDFYLLAEVLILKNENIKN